LRDRDRLIASFQNHQKRSPYHIGTGDDIKGFVFGGVFGEFVKYFIKAMV
jgi:hypothetical protein